MMIQNKLVIISILLLWSCSPKIISYSQASKPDVDYADDFIFNVVDEIPIYGDCTSIECSDKELIAFIWNNLTYPKAARAKKLEGRVYAQFVIEKNGSLSDIKILKDIGDGCGDAVLKVLNKMKNWQPGKHKGKVVRSLYTLPVTFKL